MFGQKKNEIKYEMKNDHDLIGFFLYLMRIQGSPLVRYIEMRI